ncbi:hypothetical protein Dsin_016104 [Dipteronia sinensis]|uniref:Uncharacterized protein n=1 Tax=Dipteronia sinensis TaxID=43782 RepID=A0AAE0AD90_9ROSI|nr:hypothetical protein Dsin_016104 [Dipteronia sinensis]
MSSQLLRLNAFRGEPVSSGFEWHFTPNHNSSVDSRVHVGDSGAVVTPFVQVATYATRNFATLGQLELLPPFTGASIQSL